MKTKLNIYISIILVHIFAFTLFFSHLIESNNFITSVEASIENTNNFISDPNEYDSNEIIVTYNGFITNTDFIQNLSYSIQGSIIPISDNSVMISVKSKRTLIETINKLKLNKSISSIQPNFTYQKLDTTTDPSFYKQWSLHNNGRFVDAFKNTSIVGIDINIVDVWNNYSGGREVIVAIIDTGIDETHEDLEESLWTNPNEIADDNIDNDDNGYIDDIHGWNFYLNNNEVYNKDTIEDNHGTHCAGIIAAQKNTLGIAGITSGSNIKVMSIKALGGLSGTGSTLSLLNAINYAKSMGAMICNISAGTESEDLNLLSTMKESNMLFVVAAGNGDSEKKGINNDELPLYPASFDLDNIISVANIQCNGELNPSSNFGSKSVDLAAPGTSIYSTLVNNNYGYLTGTSMAAPMVTGVVALLYSLRDDITLLQAKDIIINTVKKLPSLTDKLVSGGIVDAYSAIAIDNAMLLSLDTNAPSIKTLTKNITSSYEKKLTISISDAENHLSHVLYVKGKKTAAYFEGGTKGKELILKNNSASLIVKETTNYTIYAIDKAGNETISVIKVTITKPTKITLPKSKTLTIGKTYPLNPILTPPKVSSSLTYTSSNKAVATVGKTTGKVTAKKKGTTTITVTTQNNLTAKCKVIVSN